MSDINAKVLAAKSADELVKLAEEEGGKLSLDEAQSIFEKVSSGELADDDLGAVTGGEYHYLGQDRQYFCWKCGHMRTFTVVELHWYGDKWKCYVCGHTDSTNSLQNDTDSSGELD